jgi:hypothetical protein
MNSLILLGVLVALPIVLAFVLRVNAILLFFSVMCGELLVQFMGDDATLVLGAFVRGEAASMYAQLVLLFVPVIFTLLIVRKSLTTAKILLNIPAIILSGLVLGILAIPLLTGGMQSQIMATAPGGLLQNMKDDIVGVTVLINLVLTWLYFRHKPEGKHKKHR